MERKNIQFLGPYALFGVLVALFFGNVLLGNNTFYFRDIHRWFYPMKYFLATSLKSGELPFWCHNYFCGAPFASDIQSGVFYPLSLLFLFFPFPFSFNLYIVAHFFLGLYFCHRFLLSIGRSPAASVFGATAFCFGGFVISSINTLNNLSTVIWLPAVLWRCQSAIDGNKTTKHHLITMAVMALAILGGEPQLFIMMVGLAFVYMLSLATAPTWRSRLKPVLAFAMVVFGAVMVTMVQLGPTYQDFQQSVRHGGILYETAAKHALDPVALKHLLIPLHFPPDFAARLETLGGFFPGSGAVPWLLTIYPGFLVLPLAAAGVCFERSKTTFFWVAIFTASVVLSLGDRTPIHYWIHQLLPVFRFPEKFMLPAGFGLIVLAACGLDHLGEFLRQRRIDGKLVVRLLLLVLICDLYSNHRYLNPTCESDFYQARHADLSPIFMDTGKFRVYVDPTTTTPDSRYQRIVNYHARWQLIQLPNLGIISNIDHVDGKVGMELRYQSMLHDILSGPWSEKIGLLRSANVKYIVSNSSLEGVDALKHRIEKLTPLVYRLTDSLPRAVVIGDSASDKTLSVKMFSGASFDPAGVVLAGEDITAHYHTPFSKEVDDISYHGPGSIRIRVTTPKEGLLFLSESFYPGWQVTVNGASQAPVRLNLFFQGVGIAPGQHLVEFTYRPPHFFAFLMVSVISLLGVGIVFLRQQQPSRPLSYRKNA